MPHAEKNTHRHTQKYRTNSTRHQPGNSERASITQILIENNAISIKFDWTHPKLSNNWKQSSIKTISFCVWFLVVLVFVCYCIYINVYRVNFTPCREPLWIHAPREYAFHEFRNTSKSKMMIEKFGVWTRYSIIYIYGIFMKNIGECGMSQAHIDYRYWFYYNICFRI